jgi:hypothetical protein
MAEVVFDKTRNGLLAAHSVFSNLAARATAAQATNQICGWRDGLADDPKFDARYPAFLPT